MSRFSRYYCEKQEHNMNQSSFLKTALYVGVILLMFTVVIGFNTLRTVSINGTKTIRIAEDRFKIDDFELQIQDAINANPRNRPFPLSKRKNIDEMFLKLEQLLTGQKLPTLESTKKKWELLKDQSSPDSTELMYEFDLLHRAINKILLEDITKRVASTDKNISRLSIMKIVIGLQFFTMLIIALYLDTQYTKQRNELLSKVQEAERKVAEAIAPNSTFISNETLKNLVDSIGQEGMVRIVQTFLLELPKSEESINQLIIQKDMDELHKIAEHNKFSALEVGAEGLAELFKQLEQAEKVETANDLNSKINREGAVVMSKLQEQIASAQL